MEVSKIFLMSHITAAHLECMFKELEPGGGSMAFTAWEGVR